MDIIDEKQALELAAGEEELLNELLEAFVNDRNFSTDELLRIKSESPLEAASYVHYFKGAARQLCAKKTAASGQILEDILRGKSDASFDEALLEFSQDYRELVQYIKARKA